MNPFAQNQAKLFCLILGTNLSKSKQNYIEIPLLQAKHFEQIHFSNLCQELTNPFFKSLSRVDQSVFQIFVKRGTKCSRHKRISGITVAHCHGNSLRKGVLPRGSNYSQQLLSLLFYRFKKKLKKKLKKKINKKIKKKREPWDRTLDL